MPELAEAALPTDLGAETGVSDGSESVSSDNTATGTDGGADTGAAQAAEEVQTGSESTVETQPETDASGDGRTIPAAIRQHFSELKTQNPALYKQLKGIFFSEREFRNHFPQGPQEAVKLKEFVDTVGGEDGWQGVQDTLKGWEDLDALYSNGDKGFVDKISASDPEAFGQMMPHALEKFAELNQDNYQHLMARVLVNTLGQSPLGRVYQALAGDEKTKALAQELSQWYNGVDSLASKVPERKVDPERQKFEQEKREYEEKKQTEFRENVGKELQSFYLQNIESSLGAEFKARNRNFPQLKTSNPDSYWDMVNSTYNRVRQALSSDKTFVSKFESLLQNGDGEGAKKLAQSRAQRMMAESAKKTYNAFNIGSGAATAQAKSTTETQQQRTTVAPTTKLSKQPEPEQIDWNRTQSGMILDGKAYLKGRKELVTF